MKEDSETRIKVQVIYLDGDPRSRSEGVAKRRIKEESPCVLR